METPATTSRPTDVPVRLLLAATAVAALVVLVVPGLRSSVAVGACWASVALVLVGVLRHRPRPSRAWLLLAVVLALWAAATTISQVRGETSPAGVVLVGAGQLGAVLLALALVPRSGRRRARRGSAAGPRPGSGAHPSGGRERVLDGVVITTVLTLVTAQVVAVATSSTVSATTVVVPVVDVAVLGLLVSSLASHRLQEPSAVLAMTAALLTVAFDLLVAVGGARLAAPSDPLLVVGSVAVLLFGAAALHPTMAGTFSAETLARRRAPSAALLGLLPLVAVPLALWWVADLTSVRGLPAPVLLAGASAVAGLCLVRASGALRSSEHLADHDPLTDLVNRRGLARAVDEVPPPGGWALLLVDVDEFKQVNDTHGHALGDQLLLQVRDRLLAAAGPGATVARLGGDEFVVLVADDRVRRVADEVLRSLRSPVSVGALELRTSASIGVAPADPAADLAELVTRADIAMYAAKAAGRDAVAVFAARMREEVAHRYGLTGELQRLLGQEAAGRDGRLEVHYQPLVDLRSGSVVGAEALVRWAHPRHGLMAPDGFLDLVAANRWDAALDAAVLRQVVHQLAGWRDAGLDPVPISVNLTCASLLDPHLDDRVLAVLAERAIPPSWLHLEITEHEELPLDGPAGDTLRRLRSAGATVHLDDYGTGYTSLSYLSRFPVEVLKLDRSVVDSIAAGEQAQLVAGIGAMAATLGLDLLAEGVETAEQREVLLAIGVRYGQGYLFSRPLAADDYAEQVLARPGGALGGPAPGRPPHEDEPSPAAIPHQLAPRPRCSVEDAHRPVDAAVRRRPPGRP
ncbi:bifunctional diguanylate cyclase/phosphodiesterase [uncultured Pseudokineococcus sp.]|uniref:putative bifunctional diguanylate cyclase/phosphodiesterase n=1 Tax=uncultured Pseudokineococcus sp. TaxID=1642928 RepID=UPI0026266821|nr:EAL domain-containing protein [uncultured Pseudokineococcus sp.]